jgi:hypothetical protein
LWEIYKRAFLVDELKDVQAKQDRVLEAMGQDSDENWRGQRLAGATYNRLCAREVDLKMSQWLRVTILASFVCGEVYLELSMILGI